MRGGGWVNTTIFGVVSYDLVLVCPLETAHTYLDHLWLVIDLYLMILQKNKNKNKKSKFHKKKT